MTYFLDTNTCIRYLNGESASVKRRLEKLAPQVLRLCSIVKAELLFGAAKSRAPSRVLSSLERFFAVFESWPFDDPAARAYGTIRADLERNGTPIGPNDMLIAAIAVAHDAILVTHNSREFGRVVSLRQEDWE